MLQTRQDRENAEFIRDLSDEYRREQYTAEDAHMIACCLFYHYCRGWDAAKIGKLVRIPAAAVPSIIRERDYLFNQWRDRMCPNLYALPPPLPDYIWA